MFTCSFDIFKKENLRYAWLSGRYTDQELKDKYWQEYIAYCQKCNYISDAE